MRDVKTRQCRLSTFLFMLLYFGACFVGELRIRNAFDRIHFSAGQPCYRLGRVRVYLTVLLRVFIFSFH